MRILFCNYEYPPLGGGGGVVNALLAEELARSHEVTVLTSCGMGLPPRAVEQGVTVVRVPVLMRTQQSVASLASMLSYVPQALHAGRQLLRAQPFDVINTHFVVPTGPVGDRLARRAGIPNVLSLHGGDLYDPSKRLSPHRYWPLRVLIRRLLRRADAVVGQSRNTLENMRRYYTPDIAGECIALGIRRPPAGRAARGDYGLPGDAVLLVTIGRLVARKAVDQLIRMLGEREHLLVVGTGPAEPQLRQLAGELGCADRVHFLGHVEETEKFRVLRMCDLYVSTSQHEGFGLVFLEAMACGLPVICYDHGGQTDFLDDGRTGAVVALNQRQVFAAALHRLAADAGARGEIGAHNLAHVESYFIDTCARRYEALFERVVA